MSALSGDIPKIKLATLDKAKKRFFAAVIAGMVQGRLLRQRNQIGPGGRRTRPKWNKYGGAKFCARKQECVRRANTVGADSTWH